MRDSHYLVLQLVQASGFLDVLSISTMVDAGLALFERSPSYKKFGMNTVDALGRAGYSFHPQGPFAGSADGWEGPAIMQHSNHYDYYDNYDRHVNRLEDGIHYRLEMAIRAEEEDYDSDSTDISTYIIPDGEPGDNFQYHLDLDDCALQDILWSTPDRESIKPLAMLHHIAWFWGRQRPGYTRPAGHGLGLGLDVGLGLGLPGYTRPAGHGYYIGDDDMSWDDDDDDIDSDEDLFGDDAEMEARRVGVIRRARVLRDDVEDDDWDPPEEPVIPRMPWFVPEGEEWSIEMCLEWIGELEGAYPTDHPIT